jgi:hypothetical protein
MAGRDLTGLWLLWQTTLRMSAFIFGRCLV